MPTTGTITNACLPATMETSPNNRENICELMLEDFTGSHHRLVSPKLIYLLLWYYTSHLADTDDKYTKAHACRYTQASVLTPVHAHTHTNTHVCLHTHTNVHAHTCAWTHSWGQLHSIYNGSPLVYSKSSSKVWCFAVVVRLSTLISFDEDSRRRMCGYSIYTYM